MSFTKIQLQNNSKVVIIFIVAMLLNSICCKKEINNTQTNCNDFTSSNFTVSSPHMVTNELLIDPSNSSNPYDSIGYYHNLAMDLFAINRIWERSESHNLYDANFGFIDSFFRELSLCQNFANHDSIELILSLLRDIEENVYDASSMLQYISNLSFSQDLLDYLESIHNIIESVNIYQSLSIRDVLSNRVDSIKMIETDILSSTLSTNEKWIALVSSSVARYSLTYYASTICFSDNPWDLDGDIDPDSVYSEEYFIIVGANWKAVGNADFQNAAAGAAGAITFLIAGVETGGVAWLAVAAASAGGSAAELLWQIIFGDAFVIWICC